MSYRVNRSLGFQHWGVTNPWVWANYGQPQRKRGYVSPMVFQTAGPYLKSAHLGQDVPASASEAELELLRRTEEDLRRSQRMEKYAIAGVLIAGTSLIMAYRFYSKQGRVTANRRARRRRRRRTSRRR